MHMSQSSQHSADYWPTVDQVSMECQWRYQLRCQPSVDHDSTADAFSTHGPIYAL